ncbi:MAG: oligosaccharide flippase family protein [Chloroflexi bacterium]|nr:oligosaccharide flippase family protein [Chloroflexota bacterium]
MNPVKLAKGTSLYLVSSGLSQIKVHLKSRLFINSYFLMIASGLTSLLGFIFWTIVARFYTPAQVGIASGVMASIALISNFSNLGFSFGIIRFLPMTKEKAGIVNSCLTLSGLLAALLAFVFVLGTPVWSPALAFIQKDLLAFIAFIVFTFGITMLMLQKSIFAALRAASYTVVQQGINGVLKLVLPAALVSLGTMGIVASYGIAIWVTVALANLLLVRVIRGYIPKPTFRRDVIKTIIPYSFGNYIAENIGGLPPFIVPLVIVNFLGAELNAYFYIAFLIVTLLYMIPLGVITSFFVEGSHEPDKIAANAVRALKFIFFLIAPPLLVILLIGDKVLLIFGRAYSENAASVLRLLSLSVIPFAFTELWVTIQRVRMRIRPVFVVYTCSSTLILGLGFLLMYLIGLPGIGLGWLLGYTTVALGLGVFELVKKGRSRSIVAA